MTVVIHNDSLNAAAIHFSDYLCDTNWISHLTPRPLLAEHGTKGADKAVPVHSEAAIAYVMEFNFLTQAALERRSVTVSRLPQACNAGLDRKKFSLFLIGKVLLKFVSCNGARSDDGKVAVQHAQELRHFINRALANELANLGYARIIVNLALDFPLM